MVHHSNQGGSLEDHLYLCSPAMGKDTNPHYYKLGRTSTPQPLSTELVIYSLGTKFKRVVKQKFVKQVNYILR